MESKRDHFKDYLERGSVNESLSVAMTELSRAQVPPDQVLNFIRKQIGADECENVDALIRENHELRARLEQLQDELEVYRNG